jgi:PAS domain S-box-containing protein
MAKPKVLIVVDDEIIAADLQKRLFHLDYETVGVVSDDEDAVNSVIISAPDVVLMDVRLQKNFNAFKAASLDRTKSNFSVVYLNPCDDEEEIELLSTTGPFGFIQKPFEEKNLSTAIEMAMYRKGFEQKYKENEVWYGAALRSISEAIITADANGSVRFMNAAAEKLTGWIMDEAIGENIQNVFRIVDDVNETLSGDPVTQILNNKVTAILKNYATLISRDRIKARIEESASPIKNKIGQIIGVVLVFRDMTGFKRTAEIMNVAEGYSQNIIQCSPDMIVAVDKDQNISEFNRSAEKIYGYRMKEVKGKKLKILFADESEGMKIFNTTVNKGHYVQEVLNRRKNGVVFHSLLSSSILRNINGETIGVMWVSRDTTENRKAEQALRESEERYRSLVELLPDPVIVHVKGKIVFFNSAAVHVFACRSADECLGRNIFDMIHPDSRSVVKERIKQMTQEGRRVPVIEEKFIRLDGTSFDAEVVAIPFVWKGDPAIQVVLRDVSERRKAEMIIRSSEIKFRSLLDKITDGIFQTTPDGELLTANPALVQMLGYHSASELLLINIEKDIYLDPEDHRQYLKLLCKGQQIKNKEFKLRRIDGKIITVLENASVIRNKLGDILYYESTITDISIIKNANELLKLSNERNRIFIEKSDEAVWCANALKSISTGLSDERQILHLMEDFRIVECNDAMARMYGYKHAEELTGAKLNRILRLSCPENDYYLHSFIRSKYRIMNIESQELGGQGHIRYLLRNIIGIVEGGCLVRVWGTQKDITNQIQSADRPSKQKDGKMLEQKINKTKSKTTVKKGRGSVNKRQKK